MEISMLSSNVLHSWASWAWNSLQLAEALVSSSNDEIIAILNPIKIVLISSQKSPLAPLLRTSPSKTFNHIKPVRGKTPRLVGTGPSSSRYQPTGQRDENHRNYACNPRDDSAGLSPPFWTVWNWSEDTILPTGLHCSERLFSTYRQAAQRVLTAAKRLQF